MEVVVPVNVLLIAKVPPISSTRSCIPSNPNPSRRDAISNPPPSSCINRVKSSGEGDCPTANRFISRVGSESGFGAGAAAILDSLGDLRRRTLGPIE